MKPTPKITIEGPPGCGKSAIAFLIKNALLNRHINCEITGAEDEVPGAMDATWSDRLDAIRWNSVQIKTVRTPRTIGPALTTSSPPAPSPPPAAR